MSQGVEWHGLRPVHKISALEKLLRIFLNFNDTHSIQFEVRDYWAFSNPNQHNVAFRLVWLAGLVTIQDHSNTDGTTKFTQQERTR
jgi:hypothetical protein